ncbi:MAG: hypothetical protein ABI628_05210 [Chloroflexota bacterium]
MSEARGGAGAIDAEERRTLAGLADVLIPAGAGMPSASEAGVSAEWLDTVLAARADLAEPLARILQAATGSDPVAEVQRLQATDPVAFGILATVVPGAYYMNPRIRELIGYPGQRAVAIDPGDGADAEAQALIASVRARGTIFRPTPDAPGDEA